MRLGGQVTRYVGDITHRTEESTLKHIEACARICYRSEASKDTVGRNRFLHALNRKGHGSLFEHSQITVSLSSFFADQFVEYLFDSGMYRFFDMNYINRGNFIGGNLRCWLRAYADLGNIELLGAVKSALPEFLKEWDVEEVPSALLRPEEVPTNIHRFAAYAEVDRGVLGEFTRHDFGFSVESSRYCNYSKDKYSNEIDIIDQGTIGFFPKKGDHNEEAARMIWKEACQQSETSYLAMVQVAPPEIARQVLNMSLRTRMYISGIPLYWLNFFAMRMPSTAQPNIRVIAAPLHAIMYSDMASS